jgi:hypothetical protein
MGNREEVDAMSKRKGRGPAAETLAKIDAFIEIARAIQPCPVRAIAYQMFIRKLIASMAEKDTKKVSNWGVAARERGMMPWQWITDQTRQKEGLPSWKDPEAYAGFVQRVYRKNKWEGQPTHISVWSEKSTISGTIRPVLRKYELDFQVLHGWSGATPIWNMAQANLARQQKTLVLYIGDWDPSGMYMSELDLPRRLARYSTNDPSDKDITPAEVRRILAQARLEIRRIALTKADTIALGRALAFPASDKAPKFDKNGKIINRGDSRYPWFKDNIGDWCWELDALDPNILRDRLERVVRANLDRERWDRYVHIEQLERDAIIEHCTAWTSISGPVPK